MASAEVDVGTGITVTFTNFAPQLIDVAWDGVEVEVIETTHLSTFAAAATQPAARTYQMGDLIDYGQVTITYQVNPDDHLIGSDATNPVGTEATLTITFLDTGDAAGATWAATCGLQSLSPLSAAIDSVMTGTAVFKVLGEPTVTPDA